MKKIFFLMLAFLIWSAASMNAQVLIGGDGTGNPDPSAVLELQSSDKGLLLPRVELTSTGDPAPLSAFVNGMTVYNTSTINDVTQGTYYCDGYRWIKVRNSFDVIQKSDLSGDVIKLMVDLAKTQGIVTNNCPPTVVGKNGTYAVGDFDVAGCWMINNSKEGTPSATHYKEGLEGELAEGVYGYYYTWEQAGTACPEGFRLPIPHDWLVLKAIENSDETKRKLWRNGFLQLTQLGGTRYPDSTWSDVAFGYWWANVPHINVHELMKLERLETWRGALATVRCVMN
jgi:hypothetical protein